MATVGDLRKRIEMLFGVKPKSNREEEHRELSQEEISSNDGLDYRYSMEDRIKDVLEQFFVEECINRHLSWRAVYENKKCKPIPVYHKISFPNDKVQLKFVWPSTSRDLIDNTLVRLGFIPVGASEDKLCLMVPRYRGYGELSYAQKWVRKINQEYSCYCYQESKKAIVLFDEMIDDLCNWPIEKIVPYNGTTLFKDFKFSKSVSSTCLKFIKRKMLQNAMYEMYAVDKTYIGLIVANVK